MWCSIYFLRSTGKKPKYRKEIREERKEEGEKKRKKEEKKREENWAWSAATSGVGAPGGVLVAFVS